MVVERSPIFVLHRDRDVVALVRSSVRAGSEVAEVEDWGPLREAVAGTSPLSLAVVDPFMDGGGQDPASLRELLREFPTATIVAVVETGPGRAEAVRALGEWGVSEVIAWERERTRQAVGGRLHSAKQNALAKLLRPLVRAAAPDVRGVYFLVRVLESVAAGGDAQDLADSLGISSRTLLRWCTAASLPLPRRLFTWMRIYLAAHLLDEPKRRIAAIAPVCGYSSDTALRTAINTFTKRTPKELRRDGAVLTTVELFAGELLSARAAGAR